VLILSRREKESIVINGEIEVSVIEISDGRVRLGINAPKSMDVHRKEIYDKIIEETRQAAKGKNRLNELGKIPVNKQNEKK